MLVVVGPEDENAILSFRNIPNVQLIEIAELNAYDVLCNDWIVFTRDNLPGAPRPVVATAPPCRGGTVMKDPRDIIIEPIVSEKSYALIEQGVYTFRVHSSATKPEIHDAVRAIWGVDVVKVNTLNRKGKAQRVRKSNRVGPPARHQACARHPGRRPGDPAVREQLRTAPWPSDTASRPRPAAASRRAPTSPRSPRPAPVRQLTAPLTKSGGRNSYGRKTARHRGGGHKRQYRIIDFRRVKDGVPAKVAAIEYDPNRTCRIALLHYADGERAYIIAPRGLSAGQPAGSNEALKGINWQEAPLLLGFNTSELKPGAELLLSTERGDPLLAHWRYGLGRVAAFTSDAKSRWASEWLSWSGYGKLWGQLVRMLVRSADRSDLMVELREEGGDIVVDSEAVTAEGMFRNGLEVNVSLAAQAAQPASR